MREALEKLPLQKISLAMLMFFVFSFLLRTDNSFDQDLGRHILLGKIIAQNASGINFFQSVPKTNLFAQTQADYPFTNHHWLFELLLYWGQQVVDLQAILWLKILIILLSAAITLSIISKSKYPLLLPVGYIFFHLFRERTEFRPEIFSFLFTAITYWILERFSSNSPNRYIYALPLVQLIWVNMQIYFPVGLFLQGIFLSHLVFYKKDFNKAKVLGIIFAASSLMSFLNPNGLKGALIPFKVFESYGYTIAENQTIFLLESINFQNPNFLFVKISILMIVVSIIVGMLRRILTVKNILLIFLGLGLALMNIRSFPYLVLISMPAVLENFGPMRQKWGWAYLSFFAGVLLILESVFYLNGDYYRYSDSEKRSQVEFEENVKGAVDFVLANGLPTPIFNNFDIGSYIDYRAFGKYPVFVDGRPDSFPVDFFQKEYIPMQEDYEFFKKKAAEYDFKTIIFSHTDQTPWANNFMQSLTKDSNWDLVYLDDFMTVFLRHDMAVKMDISKLNLADLDVERYRYSNHLDYIRIGVFLLNSGYTKPAEDFVQKSLEVFPDSPIGNLIMAKLILASNEATSAVQAQKYIEKSQSGVFW